MEHSPLPATEREAITALERDWPAWQIWTVHHAVSRHTTWCARRWDGTGKTVNAYTPAHLAEYLEEQVTR